MPPGSKRPGADTPAPLASVCASASIENAATRKDILHRLRRAEGQLRGIQKMIDAGSPCMAVATQMAAVRKALDSTYVHITICFMEQQMRHTQSEGKAASDNTALVLTDIETLLSKIR